MSMQKIDDNKFVFKNDELGCQIRGLFDNDVPMLSFMDVVHGLGYVTINKSQEKKCSSTRHYDFPTKSGIRQMPFINLKDCDVLIRGARLKRWKLMEKWFADEILPNLKQMKSINVVQVEQIEGNKLKDTSKAVQFENDVTNVFEVFNNPEFGAVRCMVVDGEPWMVGKDVAIALGYGDTDQALRRHIDEEDKLTRNFDGSGQNRNMTIINESGMYSLIFSSKLDTAKKFKRWVTKEVLPSIRKTGSYTSLGEPFKNDAPVQPDDPIVDLIDAYTRDLKVAVASEVQKLRDERDEAQKEIAFLREQLKTKRCSESAYEIVKYHLIDINVEHLKEVSPYCRGVLQSRRESLALRDIGIKYGDRDCLFSVLEALGVHTKVKKVWTPNEDCINRGYVTLIEMPKYSFYTWTKLGQLYLYELLKENNIFPTIERRQLAE